MSQFPSEIPADFKPRRGLLITSGILFALSGLTLCGFAALSVFQYFVMGSMADLDPEAAKELEPMMGMMGLSTISNVFLFGGIGVLLIVVAFGCLFPRRWARPFALTLSWGWLFTGLITLLTLVMMMGMMQQIMNEAMANSGAAPPGGATMSFGGIFAIIMVIYFAIITIFLVVVPAVLLWLNWGRDVRRTLEFCDPKSRWTDRQPVPVIGLTIGAAIFGVISLPGVLMMSQEWMAQFMPASGIKYAFYAAPFAWLYVAWGSYRRQLAAWVVALLVLIGYGVAGAYNFQNIDWSLFYEQMGTPEAQVEKFVPIIEQFFDSEKLAALMAMTLLPMIGYVVWTGRYFWGNPEAGSGDQGASPMTSV